MKKFSFVMMTAFLPALFAKGTVVTKYILDKPSYSIIEDNHDGAFADYSDNLLLRNNGRAIKAFYPSDATLFTNIKTNKTFIHHYDAFFVLSAQSPTISWINEKSGIECSLIRYVDTSAKYLFDRFLLLKKKSLSMLNELNNNPDNKTELVKTYEDTLGEIEKVLGMVNDAFPQSFRQTDRIALYSFDADKAFDEYKKAFGGQPLGTTSVSQIKYGDSDWFSIKGSIKGFDNFVSDASVIDGKKIHLVRELSALEACLSDLTITTLSMVRFYTEYELSLSEGFY